MLARWASLIAIGSLAKIEASTTIDGGYTRANSRLVVAGRRRASAVANAARTSPGRRATCMTHRVALLTFHPLTTTPRAICIYMENTEYPTIYACAFSRLSPRRLRHSTVPLWLGSGSGASDRPGYVVLRAQLVRLLEALRSLSRCPATPRPLTCVRRPARPTAP